MINSDKDKDFITKKIPNETEEIHFIGNQEFPLLHPVKQQGIVISFIILLPNRVLSALPATRMSADILLAWHARSDGVQVFPSLSF